MPTVQQIGLPRRSMLARVIYLVPAFVISAMIMGTLSCRTTGSGGSGSGGATATATPGTGALAFVTNFNDGKVSSFTRNTVTGVLKHTGQVMAGKKQGPRGVIAAPSGSFLYVANLADDNIYEFSINPSNGTLTPLSPAFVSNGNNTEPDELAMNSTGSLLWVTGARGTVNSYTVNTSTGQITKSGSLGGFNTPFGITLHPSLSVLYVSDTVTGLIQPCTYNASTGVLLKNFPAAHSSDVNADTPAAIAINSAGTALFIADQKLGEVSSFSIDGTGALTSILVFQNSNVNDTPIGVGIGTNNSVEYLFTANQGLLNTVPGSVSSFVTSGTSVIVPPQTVPLSGGAPYNGPTGLVVDPQNQFVYTANNFDGTISESAIGINNLCATQICEVGLVSAESPHNANSKPFGITLAQ